MKKWQTVVLALLPITAVVLMNTVSIDFDNFRFTKDTRQLTKALDGFLTLDKYEYTLSFVLGSSSEDRLLVRDNVLANRYKGNLGRERHEVTLKTPEDTEESFAMAYIEVRDDLDGILMQYGQESGMDNEWVYVEGDGIGGVYLGLSERLAHIFLEDRESAEKLAYEGQETYFRLYEDISEEELSVIASGRPSYRSGVIYNDFPSDQYYVDVAIDPDSQEISAIDLTHSSIGDYLTILNFFYEYSAHEGVDLAKIPYKITQIVSKDEEVEIPDYITFEAFTDRMEQREKVREEMRENKYEDLPTSRIEELKIMTGCQQAMVMNEHTTTFQVLCYNVNDPMAQVISLNSYLEIVNEVTVQIPGTSAYNYYFPVSQSGYRESFPMVRYTIDPQGMVTSELVAISEFFTEMTPLASYDHHPYAEGLLPGNMDATIMQVNDYLCYQNMEGSLEMRSLTSNKVVVAEEEVSQQVYKDDTPPRSVMVEGEDYLYLMALKDVNKMLVYNKSSDSFASKLMGGYDQLAVANKVYLGDYEAQLLSKAYKEHYYIEDESHRFCAAKVIAVRKNQQGFQVVGTILEQAYKRSGDARVVFSQSMVPVKASYKIDDEGHASIDDFVVGKEGAINQLSLEALAPTYEDEIMTTWLDFGAYEEGLQDLIWVQLTEQLEKETLMSQSKVIDGGSRVLVINDK